MNRDRALAEFLNPFITPNKREKIEAALAQRTRYLTVVLEDIFQPHNASACLRSCECLGVQDVHIIENRNEYNVNPDVAMGSAKWLSLRRYNRSDNNTLECIQRLRDRGYRIVATTPNVDSFSPRDLPLDQPTALLYGTEEIGLSAEALAQADAHLKLPMYGFTQSYNISVTVAISLSALVERLRSSDIAWQLSAAEQDALRVQWQRRILKHSEELERRFEREISEPGSRGAASHEQ